MADLEINFDLYIAAQEELLEATKLMRKVLKAHPELAHLVPKILGGPAAVEPIPKRAGRKTGGKKAGGKKKPRHQNNKATRGPTTRAHCLKIIKALEATKDTGLAISDLMEKTGLNREAVSQVLYRSYPELFTKGPSPESKLVKLWNVKPGVTAATVKEE